MWRRAGVFFLPPRWSFVEVRGGRVTEAGLVVVLKDRVVGFGEGSFLRLRY